MVALPDCLVADGAGPFIATPGGVDITPGNTISVKLADQTDVVRWYLEVIGTDGSAAPVLTGVNPLTHRVSSPTTVVTFPCPDPGRVGLTYLLRSTIEDISSNTSETTFATYVPTSKGDRTGAFGEALEGDSTTGWLARFNNLVRDRARRVVQPIVLAPLSESLGVPTWSGAVYVALENLPPAWAGSASLRVVLDTTNAAPGFEANVDLIDVNGIFGPPGLVVAGSSIDTGSGSPPPGGPAPQPLVPSAYEVDLTPVLSSWAGSPGVLALRVWVTAAGAIATCRSAELIYSW